jgi:hypothetical protein
LFAADRRFAPRLRCWRPMTCSPLTRDRAVLAGALVTLLLAAGCGGNRVDQSSPAPYFQRAEPPISMASVAPRSPVVRAAPRRRPAAGCPATIRPLRTRAVAFAAVVRNEARVYASPGVALVRRFGRLNVNGVPTAFGALGRTHCAGDWIRVQLPTRPNGMLGWVRAGDVRLVRVHTRVEVDLSERRLTLYRRGSEVLRVAAAIGAPDTPTPTGSYYVNQRLVAPNPAGPFGPAALGISAFSPVLQDWIQGGPIAIHGTNRPDLIGGAVSHGCVRVRNAVLDRLFRTAVVGTPVLIRA